MFDSITLTGQEAGPTCIDLGLLAETLVLYQRVYLALDEHSLKFLIRACGAETLLALLEMDVLEATFFENKTAAGLAVKEGRHEGYGLLLVEPLELQLDRFLPPLLEGLLGRRGKARRLANRFYRVIKKALYSQDDLDLDLEYLITINDFGRLLGPMMSILAPGFEVGPGAFFQIDLLDRPQRVVRVDTNLDFRAMEAGMADWLRTSVIPGTMDPRGIIAILLGAANDLRFAANANTEMAPPPVQALLLADTVEIAVRKLMQTDPTTPIYEECNLPHVRSIRDAVNTGKRNFADVIRLVEESTPLKEWLKGKTQDRNLLKDYFLEFGRLPMTEHLPAKGLRYLLFTGAAIAAGCALGPVASGATAAALSAFDYFLADRMLNRRWKPHQFLSGPLRKFVEPVLA